MWFIIENKSEILNKILMIQTCILSISSFSMTPNCNPELQDVHITEPLCKSSPVDIQQTSG